MRIKVKKQPRPSGRMKQALGIVTESRRGIGSKGRSKGSQRGSRTRR